MILRLSTSTVTARAPVSSVCHRQDEKKAGSLQTTSVGLSAKILALKRPFSLSQVDDIVPVQK